MLELTGIAPIFRGMSILYWLVVFSLLGLATWKAKSWPRKIAWAGVVLVIFGYLPVVNYIENSKREAYARASWAHFKKLCAEKSGEKIYKKFTGVKSARVVKPLPPASDSDNFDQFWYGDPYSAPALEDRGTHAAGILTYTNAPIAPGVLGVGFDFVDVEVPTSDGAKQIKRIRYSQDMRRYAQDAVSHSESRFRRTLPARPSIP